MPEKGRVVLYTAMRDAREHYIMLKLTEKDCLLADGKKRRLSHPKRKNLRHVRATAQRLEPQQYAADRRLRRALAQAAHRYNDTDPE